MATAPATTARLSGVAAVVTAVAAALVTPAGPWQPLSVILGWVVVLGVVATVIWGPPSGLGVAVVAWLARVGVHGQADTGTAMLVGSTAALILMVELTSLSTSSRTRSVSVTDHLARMSLLGLGGAGGTAFFAYAIEVDRPFPHLIGLVAALTVAALILHLSRPRPG